MKRLLLLLIFLSAFLNVKGQSITGVVQDSTGKPLELANIMLLGLPDSTMISFAISDSQGRFSLQANGKNQPCLLLVRHLGYENWHKKFTAGQLPTKLVIEMKEQPQMLDEIAVEYNFPVVITGDTITYRTDAFTNGKERKLKDVLEKLPGFSVEDNGEIKVQGKKVDKVMVEGKDFFGGDSKMATENLPANAIENVQLLQNFTEVNPLRGLQQDESLALNVQLKEDKKYLWFGDATVAAGHRSRGQGHVNLFRYARKNSFNLIADANNTGEQAFTLQDYFRFNGGLAAMLNGSSALNLKNDALVASLLNNEQARDMTNRMLASHYLWQPDKKWQVNAFAIGLWNDLNWRSATERTFITSEQNNREMLEQQTDNQQKAGLGKVSLRYTPNPKLHLDYQALLKYSDFSSADNRISQFINFRDTISSSQSNVPLEMEQQMNLYWQLGNKQVMSWQNHWHWQDNREQLFLQSLRLPFVQNEEDKSINQRRSLQNNQLSSTVNHYYLLRPNQHLQFTAGLQHVAQKMNLLTGDQSPFNYRTSFQDWHLGGYYKILMKKLLVKAGLATHFFHLTQPDNPETTSLQKTVVAPELLAKYNFKKSEHLRFQYQLKNNFPDLLNLAPVDFIQSYNQLRQGNPFLVNGISHDLSLIYSNFNRFNFTNIYAGVNYGYAIDELSQAYQFNGLLQQSQAINAPDDNQQLSAFAKIEKQFPWITLKLGGNLNYSSITNQVEEQTNTNRNLGSSVEFSAESGKLSWLYLKVGVEWQLNQYEGLMQQQLFNNWIPAGEAEVYLGENFTARFDYEFNYFSGNGISSQFDFLEASFTYQKENSPWEIGLQGKNVLNTEFIKRTGFGSNFISLHRQWVMPVMVLIKMIYEL